MALLPPLNSLRAFEAVGRHLSFSKAANELNVTPGAVSQQIRGLEEFLEIKLFKRRNRSIVLTDSGQVFLPLLSDGFAGISAAVDSVRRSQGDEPLTITAAPSFTSKWLIPRLCKFQALHPEIDVRIDASSRLVDFVREDIDVGIRFGTGEVEGLDSIYLFSFDLIPVCSPDLMHEGKAVHDLSDIRHHTLLHSQDTDFDPSFPDWAMWLATAGVDDVDAVLAHRRNPRLSVARMHVDAPRLRTDVDLRDQRMDPDTIPAARVFPPGRGRSRDLRWPAPRSGWYFERLSMRRKGPT